MTEDVVPYPAELAARYRALGYHRGETLDQMLRAGAGAHGSREAVVCGARRISYAALDQRVDELAAGLHALGLGRGERVVVQLPNRLELIELLFALFRLGAVPVLALPGHRRAELSYFCVHTEAVAYVCVDRFGGFDYAALGGELFAQRGSTLRHVIVVGDARGHTPYESLRRAPRALPKVRADGLSLLQLSGGSTGTPKLIPRTHDDYLYSVRASVPLCGLDASSVYLVALPGVHNFPLSSPGILGTLFAGGRVVLAEQPQPDVTFPLLVREHVTITALVPPLARVWLDAKLGRGVDFPALRVLQVGGAKLDPSLAEKLTSEFSCTLQQVFGMAEGLVNYTPLDAPADQVARCQGRPISPDDELRIVDDADNEVPEGAVGHLLTRGPYTIRGYYRAPEHNLRAFTPDGYYRTGDLVRRTPEGNLVVEGRAKEQINRGGEKIAPVELEEHLLTLSGVREACVVGLPDAVLGERICAVLVGDPDLSRPIVLAHLRARGLAVFKLPDRVEFVASLPKSSVGKVDKPGLIRSLVVSMGAAEGANP